MTSTHSDDVELFKKIPYLKPKYNIQGVFLTGTPPKDSKYKKVNLG